jgi:hypothetical protein
MNIKKLSKLIKKRDKQVQNACSQFDKFHENTLNAVNEMIKSSRI